MMKYRLLFMAGIGTAVTGAGTAFPFALAQDDANYRRDHSRCDRAEDQDIE